MVAARALAANRPVAANGTDAAGPAEPADLAHAVDPADPAHLLAEGLRGQGLGVPKEVPEPHGSQPGPTCPVLAWAATGAMSLTGWPDRAPQWPDGDVVGRLDGAARLATAFANELGVDLEVDAGAVLVRRSMARDPRRRGATSVGGRCRLLPTADGSWVALSLARDDDLELLPALTGGAVPATALSVGGEGCPVPSGLWDELAAHASTRPSGELTAAAQQLGIPAGDLGAAPPPGRLPWSIARLGTRCRSGARHLVVADFSALWSGPLCAHLVGRCGAHVVKVEDAGRPDGARRGDPWLFEELHRGHEQLVVDFASRPGRQGIRALVDAADVVIEASRPRALAALGLDPAAFLGARPGRTWVSITGYGRSGPPANWVAFGDDAAVAGGLVSRQEPGAPVFCGDAIADPVSGLCAATGALASIVNGGGHLVDCSMQASSAFVSGGPCPGRHRVERSGSAWLAFHGDRCQPVAPVPPVAPLRRVSIGGVAADAAGSLA